MHQTFSYGETVNICTLVGGGFGDILRCYFSEDLGYRWSCPYWGKLERWLDETGNRFRLISASHNQFAADFFEHVPWIDSVVTLPWRSGFSSFPKEHLCGYTPMWNHQLNDLTRDIEWKMPKVYLTESEKRAVDDISEKEFVFLYPFGGYGARLKPIAYLSLIKKIIERGFRVVIGGGTHIRSGLNIKDKLIKEELDFILTREAISVVGCGVRICTELALRSYAYIGSLGCYMHVALAQGKRSYILTCYEVWDDSDVCGSNILDKDSLCMLARTINNYRYNTHLFVLMNEDMSTLNAINQCIVADLKCTNKYGYFHRIGSYKRAPVHV